MPVKTLDDSDDDSESHKSCDKDGLTPVYTVPSKEATPKAAAKPKAKPAPKVTVISSDSDSDEPIKPKAKAAPKKPAAKKAKKDESDFEDDL